MEIPLNMNNDIPGWINSLALDIYKLIQKYDALTYFQGKVKKWALAHQSEIDRQEKWKDRRKQHFEKRLNKEPRLQDEKTGPPEKDWCWEKYIIHRIESNGQGGSRHNTKVVWGWVPPELSISAEPEITRLLPLSRDHILTLEEKYTLLAAIYDSGRRGTDKIPQWKWPDFNLEVSPDELSDAQKSIIFEGLCRQILIIPQSNEDWLRAFINDVEKDLLNQKNNYTNKKSLNDQSTIPKKKRPLYKKAWVLVTGILVFLSLLTGLILNFKDLKEWLSPRENESVSTSDKKSRSSDNKNTLIVSLKRICEDIDSRPLAQQKETAKKYVGTKIKKDCFRVHGVEINPGDSTIYNLELVFPDEASFPNSGWLILCNVSKDRYPQLLFAQEGMEVYVSGEIQTTFKRVGDPYKCVVLSNLTLEFE